MLIIADAILHLQLMIAGCNLRGRRKRTMPQDDGGGKAFEAMSSPDTATPVAEIV